MVRHAGYTLIELVVVVAIVAIVSAIAFPSYSSVTRANRVAGQTTELLTALNLARNEAITRGARVSVCASTAGAACDAGNAWARGWIVFTDAGTAGEVAGTDEVLRVWPAIAEGDALTAAFPNLSFGKDGFASASDVTWTFVPNQCTGDQRRTLTVRGLGRGEVAKAPCT